MLELDQRNQQLDDPFKPMPTQTTEDDSEAFKDERALGKNKPEYLKKMEAYENEFDAKQLHFFNCAGTPRDTALNDQ